MSMTFLQLASRLRQEVAGAGTGPSSVVSQTGESKRFVDWIATADEDIQRKYNNWKFMVGTFTLNTVDGDGSYSASDCTPAVTNLRYWKKDRLKIYLSSSGVADECPLHFIDYQRWYDLYGTGSQSTGRPQHFTIGNDLSLKLGPIPNDVYVISGEYQKSITTMSANSDVPLYPSEYHMLPVYAAMMKHGRYAGAQEIYQDGEINYKRMLAEMKATQLPAQTEVGPLA